MDKRMEPEVLLEHRSFLRNLAWSLLHDEHAAEDVAGDAMLAAVRRPPRTGNLRAWLGKVTRNLALTRRRGERRRANRERVVARRESLPSVEEGVARLELQRRVVEAVLALDEPYRSTVVQRFFYDLSAGEIARRLDVSVETVRTRTKRALARLRSRLDADYGGDRSVWSLGLLALLPARKAAAGTVAGGAIVMGMKLKVAVALVLLVTFVWIARTLLHDSQPQSHGEHTTREVATGTAAEPDTEQRGDASPLDETAIDRDRDVFGFVVNEGGQPVTGATVGLVRYPIAHLDGFTLSELDSVDADARKTAADGSFIFRCEPGEEVALRVEANGYADVERRFCLAGGKVRIVLRKGVRLVFHAVNERGQPVAGVRISNFKTGDGFETRADGAYLLPEGVTGQNGRYVCDNAFSNGRIGVMAWHPDYAVPDVRPFELPGDGEHVVTIALKGGRALRGRVTDAVTGAGVAGVYISPLPFHEMKAVVTDARGEFAYAAWPDGEGDVWGQLFARKPGYALGQQAVHDRTRIDFKLVRGRTVRGRLVDGAGKAIAGAFVHATGKVGKGIDLAETTSGTDGRFVLPTLRPAWPHTLLIRARGHAKYRTLLNRDIEDLGEIVLNKGLRLEGRVQPAQEFVDVRLRGPGHGRFGADEFRRTDDLGRFRFTDLAAGSYSLSVKTPLGSALSRTIELNGDKTGVVIRFDSGVFRVRVRDAGNAAVEGALVIVGQVRKRTDAGGEARVDYKGPHRFTVFVKSPRDELLDSGHVHTTADATLDIVLQDAKYVSGRVELEGKPLATAVVYCRAGERTISGVSDANGRFRLKVPAHKELHLSLSGQVGERVRPLFGEIKAVPAGATNLVLRARKLAMDRTLRVRVTTPSGVGLAGIRVEAWPRFGVRRTPSVTDAEGRVELADLPEVEITVVTWFHPRVDAWKRWCGPEPVHVVADGQEVVLAFREAVPISGVVLLPDGTPVKTIVSAYRGGRWSIAQTASDEQGRFSLNIPANEPEAVRIEVDPAHNMELRGSGLRVAVKENVAPGTRDLRIQLERE